MQKQKIILVEDEEDIAALIKLQGEMAGYKVHVEVDGLNGYRTIEKERPDLVILDVMLPGLSGLDVCRKMKNHPELRGIPVIIISAKGDELDIVLGLELGADDYVAKPFSPKVLFSRVRAVLRRGMEPPEQVAKTLVVGSLSLEADRYQVKKNDKYIPLTLSEFGILRRLMVSSGKVLTRNQLLDDIQSSDVFVVDRNIDVHIASLRKKLGPNFNSIETVRGVGYRFTEEE